MPSDVNIEEWRRKRLLSTMFGSWQMNTARLYDQESEESRELCIHHFYWRSQKMAIRNLFKLLNAGDKRVLSTFTINHFVRLVSYRKGITRWRGYVQLRNRMNCLFPLDNWIGGTVTRSNPLCRLFVRWKEWCQRARKTAEVNSISKFLSNRRSGRVFAAFNQNSDRLMRQDSSMSLARVHSVELFFRRVLNKLQANIHRRRSQRRKQVETSYHHQVSQLGKAFERLGQNVGNRVVSRRIGNILQSRYEGSTTRAVLLRLIRNVAARCDIDKYNRTAYLLTDFGLMHRHLILLKKSHGLKALRRFAERRRRVRYRELAGTKCYRRKMMSEMLQRLIARSNIPAHCDSSQITVARFNREHEYISDTRAVRFRSKFKLSKALQQWLRALRRGQRQRLSQCRAMVLWRLYRQKCAVYRRWVPFAASLKYKRSMLLQARQSYVHQQLIRPVCRAWTKVYTEHKYGLQTRADRVQALVRRIALHWLARSRQRSLRRLSHINRLCAKHISTDLYSSKPGTRVGVDEKQLRSRSPSGNDSGDDDLVSRSHLVLSRPRGLPPPLESVTASTGLPTRTNSAINSSLRYPSNPNLQRGSLTPFMYTADNHCLSGPNIYSSLSDRGGYLMYDYLRTESEVSVPYGQQQIPEPPVDKALIWQYIHTIEQYLDSHSQSHSQSQAEAELPNLFRTELQAELNTMLQYLTV